MSTDQELIDKYIRNELSPTDAEQFQLRMEDSRFSELLTEYEQLKTALKEVETENFKNMLKIHESSNAKRPLLSYRLIWIFLIGTFAIGGTIALYKSQNPETSKREQIYASYYAPYPNVIDPITKGEQNHASVFQMYELKKYQQVVSQLKDKSPKSTEETFYLANTYMATGKYKEASSLFLKTSESTTHRDASNWYIALICIKSNKINCLPLFDEISKNKNSFYHQKATDLLIQIR